MRRECLQAHARQGLEARPFAPWLAGSVQLVHQGLPQCPLHLVPVMSKPAQQVNGGLSDRDVRVLPNEVLWLEPEP